MNNQALRNTRKQRETLPAAHLVPVSWGYPSHYSPKRQARKAVCELNSMLVGHAA